VKPAANVPWSHRSPGSRGASLRKITQCRRGWHRCSLLGCPAGYFGVSAWLSLTDLPRGDLGSGFLRLSNFGSDSDGVTVAGSLVLRAELRDMFVTCRKG
jgi:hypothetical protein